MAIVNIVASNNVDTSATLEQSEIQLAVISANTDCDLDFQSKFPAMATDLLSSGFVSEIGYGCRFVSRKAEVYECLRLGFGCFVEMIYRVAG